jgi:cell division protein FtsQ
VGVTVIITIGVALFSWVSHSAYFRVQGVAVVGNTHESSEQILTMTGLDKHPAMLDIKPREISSTLSQLRWVASVRVERHWPNHLRLVVTERHPVAVAPDVTGRYYLVDRTGRQLDPAPEGTDLPRLVVGGTMHRWPFEHWARPAATVAATLPRAFGSQVMVIRVTRNGSVTLRLTTPVAFYLGDLTQLHAKYVAVASIIAGQPLHPNSYVDVSVPSAVTVQLRPSV